MAWIFLLLLLLPQACFGGVSASFCPGFALSSRMGSASCWVAFRPSDPAPGHSRICIPREIWLQRLRDGGGPGCGRASGRWRSFSPLLNDPGHRELKITEHDWVVSRLPDPADSGYASGLLVRIERLRERASRLLESRDRSGIFRRLILDQRGGPNAAPVLQALGFVHLITATGIHLYFLALVWNSALVRLCAFLRIPVRIGLRLRAAAVATTWAFAWALCGARAGMLRPILVAGLRALATKSGFRWRAFSPLAIALVLDLGVAAFRREDLGQGRWLYALAVGGGLWASSASQREGREQEQGSARSSQHFRLALGSWLLPALFEAYHLGAIAPATPILSLITLPIYAGLVFPALILTLALGSNCLFVLIVELAQRITELVCTVLLQGFAPIVLVSQAALTSGALLAAFSLALGFRLRSFLAGLILLRLWSGMSFAAELTRKAARVEQLDVGQGDAALVYRATEVGMVDSGSGHIPDSQWLRIFEQRGIQRISWVFLTHLDEDHSGGLLRLAKLLPVDCAYVAPSQLRDERGKQYARALQEEGIALAARPESCVPFPVHLTHDGRANSGNRSMGAIWVPLRDGGFYFSAGDSDEAQERELLSWTSSQAESSDPRPRILKVSHHGSRFSSDPEFLRRIAPTQAWISDGVGNRFGHPAISTIDRLQTRGIAILRTDQIGSLRN